MHIVKPTRRFDQVSYQNAVFIADNIINVTNAIKTQ